MSAIRRTASRILRFVARHAPEASRSWASAMLREMDFAGDDWAALRWALGSTTAICWHSLVQGLRDSRRSGVWSMRGIKRWMPSVMFGIAAAVAILAISVMALSSLTHTSWFEPSHGRRFERLFIIAIPLVVYLFSAAALWRSRRRTVSGILAAGVILITHSVAYFVTYG